MHDIGLFNLGNAIGAWAGGAVIAAGFGYAAPNGAGAILSAGALVLARLSGWMGRKGSEIVLSGHAPART